ncbi:hypothetical protein ACWCHM_10170 [Micromonospora sp. SCSIO 07396]|uniref:DUF4062 domain-containing protein n=1 Tax=Micromonospora humidisoli TaxID=2807622 RepID=A0ABS2JFP2_9ACTN|nr:MULTISPECIES: hypothetical protein [Micromonospora]MBM7085335.1 hypothetical protein [Micromonospora humidisoli]
MLCGASDTDRIKGQFVRIVSDYGAEPWHYQSGRVLHLNMAGASWAGNSRSTVQNADLCVFVIVEKYGSITWETELRTALLAGKPFLVFCLEDTYKAYLTLRKSVADLSTLTNPNEKRLVEIIRELEGDRQFTVIPFSYDLFGEELRRQLATLFGLSLNRLEERNLRSLAARMFGDPARLTSADLAVAATIAIDEVEEKGLRKQAVRALAERRAADEETVLSLLGSTEQGVQRLTLQLLPDLYTPRPAEPDFLEQCVRVANSSDDVGLARRLIPSLLSLDLAGAVQALAELDLSEVGSRRRLATALEQHEADIRRLRLTAEVRALLIRCLGGTDESDWKARCKAFSDRLGS